MKHRSGLSVRASTQPGVTARPVCSRLTQPFRLSQSWTFGTFKLHNSNIFLSCSNSRTGDPRSVPAPDSSRRLFLGSPWELMGFSLSLHRLNGSLYLRHKRPHSQSPCAAGMEKVEKSGFEPGKKGGVGEGVFFFFNYFSLSYSDF